MSKPKILLNIGTYLPGYRGGGPTQSVKNLVKALSEEYDFYIVTSNRDMGVNEPYKNVDTDQWNVSGAVKIFYSSDQNKSKNLKKILRNNFFSLIFLNSFFSLDTIRLLIYRKRFNLNTPIVLMPRGELSEGALNIKKSKKMMYLKVAKKFKLLNDIHYLSTAEDEYKQINYLLKTEKISKVSNIPNTEKKINLNTKDEGTLKLVFLSRITHKKNLDYALRILKNCKGNIIFDIYGTIEEENYWKKCKVIIMQLPNNIIVNYKGELPNEKVISTLSNYDLFYFPTKSENYGHVISEALQASLPVLISDQTPWNNSEQLNIGWVYPLEEQLLYASKIEELVVISREDINIIKKDIYNNYNLEQKIEKIAKDYKILINNIIL